MKFRETGEVWFAPNMKEVTDHMPWAPKGARNSETSGGQVLFV